MMKMQKKWFVFGISIFVFLILFVSIRALVSMDVVRMWARVTAQFVETHFYLSLSAYVCLFAFVVALGLPLIIPFSLLGGYLFDFWFGAAAAVVGSVTGAVIFFLMARRGCDAIMHDHQGELFARFRTRMHTHGIWYLLMIHYSCVMPFFVVNSCAACAQMPLSSFILGTLIGSAPLTCVYVYTGRELGTITSFQDIFSGKVLSAFAILILLAIVAMFLQKRFVKK